MFKMIDDTEEKQEGTQPEGTQFQIEDDVSQREKQAEQEIDMFLETMPIEPVGGKKPIKQPTIDVQKLASNEDNDDDNDPSAVKAIVVGATNVMTEGVQGLENLLAEGSAWFVDNTAKAELQIANLIGVIDDKALANSLDYIDENSFSEKVHETLRFADAANQLIGKKVFANLEEMHDWSKGITDATDKEGTVTSTEFFIGLGEASAFMVDMIAGLGKFKIGQKILTTPFGASWGEIALASAGSSGVGTVIEAGREDLEEGGVDPIKLSIHAVADAAFGVALGGALKGATHVVQHWGIKDVFAPDVAYKAVRGLEGEAVKQNGKEFVNKVKDSFVKGSVFKDWDAVPNYLKIHVLGNLSDIGKSTLGMVLRDKDTAQYTAQHLNKINAAIQTELDKYTEILGKDAKDVPVVVRILQDAGLLKASTPKSGEISAQVPRGKDFDIIRLLMEPSTDKTQAKIQDAVRVLTNSLEGMRDRLASVVGGEIATHPAEEVGFSQLTDTIFKSLAKRLDLPAADLHNSADARANYFQDEMEILKPVISKVFRLNKNSDLDEGTLYVTPARIYDLYKEIANSVTNFKGTNPGYDDKVAIALRDSVLDVLDLVSDGANYKDLLHKASDIHRQRMLLLEKTGLNTLAKNPETLSQSDISKIIGDIFAKGGQEHYEELLASIPKQYQEQVEATVIRSLAFGGNKTAEAYHRAVQEEIVKAGGDFSKTALDVVKKNRQLLQSFKPKTLKGRQLYEFVTKNTEMVDSIISKVLPTSSPLITYKSEIGRGVDTIFKRVWGRVQSHENAVRNAPYMLAQVEKAYSIAKGNPIVSHTPKSVEQALKAEEIDLGKFPHSLTLIQMIRNLEDFRAPNPPEQPPMSPVAPTAPKTPTPPTTPKAPTAPVAPKAPTPPPAGVSPLNKVEGAPPGMEELPPMPLPEGSVLDTTAILGDIALGGQIGSHRVIVPAYEQLLTDYQKTLISMIKKSDAEASGLGHATEHKNDPISAINATDDVWIAQNKYLLKLQRGAKNVVIKGVDGQPRIVLGENALKWKGEARQYLKNPKLAKEPVPIESVIDMTEYNNIARALGKPDMFKGLKIHFDNYTPYGEGAAIRDADDPSRIHTIAIGRKGYTTVNHIKHNQKVSSILVHELQHVIQRAVGLPTGASKRSVASIKSRVDPLASDFEVYMQSIGEAEARFIQHIFKEINPQFAISDNIGYALHSFIRNNRRYLRRLWATNPDNTKLTALLREVGDTSGYGLPK